MGSHILNTKSVMIDGTLNWKLKNFRKDYDMEFSTFWESNVSPYYLGQVFSKGLEMLSQGNPVSRQVIYNLGFLLSLKT